MWARAGLWTYVFSIGRARRGHVTSWSGKPVGGPQFPVPQLLFVAGFIYLFILTFLVQFSQIAL